MANSIDDKRKYAATEYLKWIRLFVPYYIFFFFLFHLLLLSILSLHHVPLRAGCARTHFSLSSVASFGDVNANFHCVNSLDVLKERWIETCERSTMTNGEYMCCLLGLERPATICNIFGVDRRPESSGPASIVQYILLIFVSILYNTTYNSVERCEQFELQIVCVSVCARDEWVSLTCWEGAENIDELFVKRILIRDTCTPNATALTHKYFQFQLKKFRM